MRGRDHFWYAQISESRSMGDSSVPLYRSYGVKRRLRPWQEKVELGFSKILLFWVLGVLLLAASLAVVNFWLYYPELWIKVVLGVLLAVLILIRLTRTIRKRAKFTKKLKRMCKQRGYRIYKVQNFFQSLVWSGNREDFLLETEHSIYFVRYLTVRKYRSTVYLEKKDQIKLVKRPIQNKFTVIFDIQPRAKYYPLDFSIENEEALSKGSKTLMKTMIINPVCEEIYYKEKDGRYEVTGNGGTHFGFTVYTAGGFLEFLKREDA